MELVNPPTLVEAAFQECFPRPRPQEGVSSLAALLGWITPESNELFYQNDTEMGTTVAQMWLNHNYVFRTPQSSFVCPVVSVFVADRRPPDLMRTIVDPNPTAWEIIRVIFGADGLIGSTWDQAAQAANPYESIRLRFRAPYETQLRKLYDELYRLKPGEFKSLVCDS